MTQSRRERALWILLAIVVIVMLVFAPGLIMPSLGPAAFGILLLVVGGIQYQRERRGAADIPGGWRPSISIIVVGSLALGMGLAFGIAIALSD